MKIRDLKQVFHSELDIIYGNFQIWLFKAYPSRIPKPRKSVGKELKRFIKFDSDKMYFVKIKFKNLNTKTNFINSSKSKLVKNNDYTEFEKNDDENDLDLEY